jgi:hypothetical protein
MTDWKSFTSHRWLKAPSRSSLREKRQEYVRHIRDTVRSSVDSGQRALIVCKKEIVERKDILGWSEHVKQFTTRTTDHQEPPFPWEFEGRSLGRPCAAVD